MIQRFSVQIEFNRLRFYESYKVFNWNGRNSLDKRFLLPCHIFVLKITFFDIFRAAFNKFFRYGI